MLTERLGRLLAACAVVVGAAACRSGQSCEGLDALTQQRDAARQDYAALVDEGRTGGPAAADDVDAAHDRMHEAEAGHEQLRAACEQRI